MKQIYIHIGYPKTGTTFLQSHVFEKLHTEGKINFIWWKRDPNKIISKLINTSELYFRLNVNRDEYLTSEINIISQEGLSGSIFYKSINSKGNADKIKLAFPQAKIIIVVRNQLDLIVSLYKQLIHQGGVMSFSEFINYSGQKFEQSYSIGDNKLFLDSVKYDELIEYYRILFGKEKVLVLFFEEFIESPNSFTNKIFNFIEICNPPDIEYELGSNVGYGYYQVLLARVINRFVYSGFNRYGLFQFFPKIFNVRRVRKVLKSNSLKKILSKKYEISDENKSFIKRYYVENNKLWLNKLDIIDSPYAKKYI